jgi:hypothetical protein
LVSLDRADRAVHRRQPEPVAEGEDHGEQRGRRPVDLQPAALFVETLDERVHVISQPNIMAWSSWARLWQCAT